MQQIMFRAMGCQMLAVLDARDAAAAEAISHVPRWFAEWEQQLSRFRDDSELSRLNRTGSVHRASLALWQTVQLALAQARATNGLVTPTLLQALEAAGYDRSFDVLASSDADTNDPTETLPTTDVAPPMLSQANAAWQRIQCDTATRSIWLPAGVRLDLGGSAKGWAAAEAVRRLSRSGPALIDAGGDIAVSGPRADGTGWPIGVADPQHHDAQLDLVLLTGGGVATSGRDYRRWQRNGVWQHHLIDPRTMQPAHTDLLSATVLGPSVVACEAAAKVVLLVGSRAGLDWLEAQSALAALVILEDGRVLRSSRLAAYRWQQCAKESTYE